MVIAVLWIGVTLAINLIGVNQNAPQEIKSFMTPGLLLGVYGLVWTAQKTWNKLGKREELLDL